MGEEFYCTVKLITGEELFAHVCIDDNDGDPVLVLQNPVIMKLIEIRNGYAIKVKPWLQIPGDDFFIIKLDKIVTMTEITETRIIQFYNNYLNDDQDDKEDDNQLLGSSSNQSKVTKRMGYVTTVEDAREMLENLYKLKDNKES
jgi:hypothetical protein|tara:strand:+ start:712 stop:1143 length:432 start_codon:yes stop_codon:yes gene_type:complete